MEQQQVPQPPPVDISVNCDVVRVQAGGKYRVVTSWDQPSHNITAFSAVNGFLSHLVITAGSNKDVSVIDASAGTTVRCIQQAHNRCVNSICQPDVSPYTSHPQQSYDVFITSAADR